MYVLDTNTLIYFFKGEGLVAKNLFSHAPYTIAIPSIVLYELKVGIFKSKSPKKLSSQLEDFRQSVSVLDLGEKEAESAAEIRAHLEKTGKPIGPYDTLIAGICRAHSAVLVTHNTTEFGKVENLQITDWY